MAQKTCVRRNIPWQLRCSIKRYSLYYGIKLACNLNHNTMSFTKRYVRSQSLCSPDSNKLKSRSFEQKHANRSVFTSSAHIQADISHLTTDVYQHKDRVRWLLRHYVINSAKNAHTAVRTFLIRFSYYEMSVFYNNVHVSMLWAKVLGKCARCPYCYQMHFIVPDTSRLPKNTYIYNKSYCAAYRVETKARGRRRKLRFLTSLLRRDMNLAHWTLVSRCSKYQLHTYAVAMQ